MKKLLSLILAISMVLSLVCGASFASAETTETTTVFEEYCFSADEVATLNDVMSNNKNKMQAENAQLTTGDGTVWWDATDTSTGDASYFRASNMKAFANHSWKWLDINDEALTDNAVSYTVIQLASTYQRILSKYNLTRIDADEGMQVGFVLEKPDNVGFYKAVVNARYEGENAVFDFYLADEIPECEQSEDDVIKNYIKEEMLSHSDGSFSNTYEDYEFSDLIYANSSNIAFVVAQGPTNVDATNTTTEQGMRLTKLTLTKVDVTSIALSLDSAVIDASDTAQATVTATLSDETTKPVADTFISYTVSEEGDVIDVAPDGTITAKGTGTATVTATVGGLTDSVEITVVAPEEDEDFTNEFTGENGYTEDETKAFEEANPTTTVNVYTAVLGGNTGEAKANPVAVGEIFTTTADETDGDGNIFRYWALGLTENKKVLTRERTLKVMATTDVKHVIAVYEPENTAATVTGESFYNANGQLLTDVSISDNKMPSLPSMAGYGTASVWVQYGTDKEFAAGDDAPKDNLMFVAKYVEPTTTYAITVVNGTQSGNGSYAYGDEVTCTATVPDDKVFKCWTKTVGDTTRIISLDSEYTFNVWEACTLKAVFADEAPVFSGNTFSIILSEMTGTIDNNTAYMAEFVGLADAVEKGIAFGNKRVAMTTDATQFTVVNDTTETEIKGYAILSDGTVIYDK